MYTINSFYNVDIFKDKTLDIILDDLTKAVSRPYIISYVKDLIEKKTPFTMLMLDVDNFKQINDRYGHLMGDEVLSIVGGRLIEYIGDSGFVGRYGGDEFLIILNGQYSYDDVWLKIRKLLNICFRKEFVVLDNKIYITATVGSVSFPYDGTTYNDLFMSADKALYRGKQKGRNCFIIYNRALHYKIDTHTNHQMILYEMMNKLFDSFDSSVNFESSIISSFKLLCDFVGLTNVNLVFKDKKAITYTTKGEIDISYEILDETHQEVNSQRIKVVNNYYELKDQYQGLYDICKKKKIKAFNLLLLCSNENEFGYIIFIDHDRKRIWQPDEIALFVYFSRLLSLNLEIMTLKSKVK